MDELSAHTAMAEALVARGLASPDQVAASRTTLEAELATGGEGFVPAATPAAIHSSVIPGGEDDDGSAISAAAFAGPATPAGYVFDAIPHATTADLEAQAAWRNALFAEGVPPVLAREMDRRVAQGLAKPPTPQEGALREQEGMQTLSKLWGADRDRLLAVAKQEVQRLARHQPGLIDLLNQSGKGNDPWLAVTLVNLARAKGRA